MATEGRSLKSQNATWLWSIAALDAVLLLAFQLYGAPSSLTSGSAIFKELELRGVLTAAAPVLVLLLTSIFSSNFKAILVYWRLRDVLPSHRAFTVHAPRDSRIDMAALRRNVGDLPDTPREQSSRWYQLYKKAGNDVPVVMAHRHFLLFRDLAAMSVVLFAAVSATLWFFDRPLTLPAALLFGAQYVLSAIAARHNGVRMVTNVLALHSAKKVR